MKRMEIKDMIAYMRLIFNNDDNISFNRIINVPKRKVGEVTLSKYRNFALDNSMSLFSAAYELSSPQVKKFINVIKEYRSLLLDNFEVEFDNLLSDINYHQYLVDMDGIDRANDRMDNINELKEAFIKAIDDGRDIIEYLNELILFSSRDEQTGPAVVLSTIHGVKGLEFDNVYMIGMCENIFPRRTDFGNIKELEEERRVCYVGLTRARKKLVLTNYCFDFKGDYFDNSRFIEEMNLEVIEKDIKPDPGFIF